MSFTFLLIHRRQFNRYLFVCYYACKNTLFSFYLTLSLYETLAHCFLLFWLLQMVLGVLALQTCISSNGFYLFVVRSLSEFYSFCNIQSITFSFRMPSYTGLKSTSVVNRYLGVESLMAFNEASSLSKVSASSVVQAT